MPSSRIMANQTDILKNSSGKLNRIIIGKKGASSNIMTIWDGNSTEPGYILTIIDTTAQAGTYDFGGVTLRNGLKIVTGTGTAPDALVVFDE